jgi:hypothetical protein
LPRQIPPGTTSSPWAGRPQSRTTNPISLNDLIASVAHGMHL